jgi:hypothetical protein
MKAFAAIGLVLALLAFACAVWCVLQINKKTKQ